MAALNWVLKRGINLASLHLPCNVYSTAEKQSIRGAVTSLALNGRLNKLETISVLNCTYINDADLAAVLSRCYNSVKSIDIRNCEGLTESAAAHIKRCTKLEAFAPKGNESTSEMVDIFHSCRKLRKVAFQESLIELQGSVNNEMVLSVANNCNLLEHLDLEFCRAVSDVAIRRVAESCPLLQYVNLRYTNITHVSVLSLCNSCPVLKRIFLGNCNLTDAAVLAVAERLPGLTHIDLSLIDAITSSAVETLASKCLNIEHIDVLCCININDATLAKIAKQCSKLEVLLVRDCIAVTAVGLTYIATKCSKLNFVDATYNDTRASLIQLFPHVEWHQY